MRIKDISHVRGKVRIKLMSEDEVQRALKKLDKPWLQPFRQARNLRLQLLKLSAPIEY